MLKLIRKIQKVREWKIGRFLPIYACIRYTNLILLYRSILPFMQQTRITWVMKDFYVLLLLYKFTSYQHQE